MTNPAAPQARGLHALIVTRTRMITPVVVACPTVTSLEMATEPPGSCRPLHASPGAHAHAHTLTHVPHTHTPSYTHIPCDMQAATHTNMQTTLSV